MLATTNTKSRRTREKNHTNRRPTIQFVPNWTCWYKAETC